MRSIAFLLALGACSFRHGRLPEEVPDDAGEVDSAAEDAAPPDAPTGCMATYTVVNGTSRYRVGMGTWFAAETACEADGAHLVVIGDATENMFVLSLDPDGDIWIGMSDHLVEDTFRWVNGGTIADNDPSWQFMQPNDSGGAEDCGEMNAGGAWNDNGCQFAQTYVCECDGASLPANRTWCETGTDAHCDICGDACTGDEECEPFQACVAD